jgi:hypothetical protein
VRTLATATLALALAAPAVAAPPKQGVLVPGRSLGGLALGATQRQVRAAWGSSFGRCRDCLRPTWYYTYRRFQPQGAGVQFRRGRVEAIFTLWSPKGWRTTRGLKVGDGVSRVTDLYGPLARMQCAGYYALVVPTPGGVNAIYIGGESVFGFGLLSFRTPICR